MNATGASTPNARPVLSLADLEAFDTPQGRDPEKVCRCPECKGSERAFHFNTATGAFRCWRASCGIRGKLSDFWQDRPQQSRKQRASNALSAAFALAPKDCSPNAINAPHSPTEREQSAPATAATWQTLFAQSKPASGTAAAAYLARRGIPDATSEAASARVLRLYPGNYRRDYVVFPFCDRDGAPVAFQARAIDSEADGHQARGSKSAGVFSTCADALKAESVILCEAPIDALSLAACGFEAVALGGTSAPAWIVNALAFKRVYLAFDNDQNGAGDAAAAKLAPDLQSFGASVSRLAPPREDAAEKSDWNAMLLHIGAPALRDWLTERLHIPEPAKAPAPCEPNAEIMPPEIAAPEYSEPDATGKDTRCVSCRAYCGTAALCAFCCREVNS
jgi:hypothetical protein